MAPADSDVLPVLDIRLQLRDLSDQLLRPLHPLLPGFSCRHGVPRPLDGHDVVGILDRDGRQWLVPSPRVDARSGGVTALVGGSGG